jgi:hypothetical protein
VDGGLNGIIKKVVLSGKPEVGLGAVKLTINAELVICSSRRGQKPFFRWALI